MGTTNFYRAILDNFQELVVVMDDKFDVVYQNKAMLGVFGDHVGEKCYGAFEHRNSVCEGCGVRKSFEEGKPVTVLRVGIDSDGKSGFFENLCFVISDADNGDMFVEVIRDVSNRVSLENDVKERNVELGYLNDELKKQYEKLERMQTHLVQSEKMASLGSLVAGVSHEINTPVGIGLTGITHLQEVVKELKKQYEKQEMGEEDFRNFLKQTEELCRSVEVNLNRAASLVRSFKQVAVDQSSAEKREFGLKEYVEEILMSLRNKTKKTRHTFKLDIDENLRLNSYPGAFSQIITNFVINSLVHAYGEDDSGNITIGASKKDDTLVFTYKDDGRGMSDEVLKKIFDPFFTTNREHGGSGLGLNIVYNIVEQQLSGNIECKSSVGNGTEFIIVIPVK
jgi:signal transduction histidine kinase